MTQKLIFKLFLSFGVFFFLSANAQTGSLSSNSPCQLMVSQSTCTVNLNWAKSNTPIACLWLSTGSLFACSGGDTDSANWQYANVSPDLFLLKAHRSWETISFSDVEIARVSIKASPPIIPAYQASFVSQSVPLTVTAGQTYPVSVTMQNDGSDTWSPGGNYSLGSQNDNVTWGLLRVSTQGLTGTGQQVTFHFNITAPASPGTFIFQWRMLREGVTWFGSSSTSTSVTVVAAPITYNYAQFIPYGTSRTGYFSNAPAGLYDPNLFWKTIPRSSTRTDVQWGPAKPGYLGALATGVEEHEVKTNCFAGQSFIWLNGYRDDYAPSTVFPSGFSARFAVTTTKAILVDSNGTTDITNGGNCGTNGQPYAKYIVDSNPYIIRVWGNVYDYQGNFAKRWFWQARYTLHSAVANSCWIGSGSNVRPALLQEEVWWSDGQWELGTGEMGTPTNGPNTGSADASKFEPTGNNIVLQRAQYMALDAGWLWQGSNYCLRSAM